MSLRCCSLTLPCLAQASHVLNLPAVEPWLTWPRAGLNIIITRRQPEDYSHRAYTWESSSLNHGGQHSYHAHDVESRLQINSPLITSLRRHPEGVAPLEGWSIGCRRLAPTGAGSPVRGHRVL